MITRALRAELRKLRYSKLWWVLLIPALLVDYLISVIGALIATLPDQEVLRQIGGRFPSLLGVSVTYSVAFTSLLTVSLGIAATAAEFRQQTLTTTLLVVPNRTVVLAAKAAVWAGVGLLYGVTVGVAAVLGGLTAGGWSAFPPAEQLLAVTVVGTVVIVAWTLAGLGIGTVVTNPVVAILGTLGIRLVVETLAGFGLRRAGAGVIADVLPSAASMNATRALAADFAVGQAPFRTQAEFEDLLVRGSLSWWMAGAVFAVWVLACCLGAWWKAERRDVT